MRYVMGQRMFALGTDFTIHDEHGQAAFTVDGKVFSIGDKLTIHDLSGAEVALIRQRLIALRPAYDIYRGGQLVATVKQALFTLLRARFEVDVPGPDDLEAQGDFLDHEYTFTRGNQVVATVSKRWFSLTDTYGVEVAPGEDDVLILACTVVIDLAAHNDRHRE